MSLSPPSWTLVNVIIRDKTMNWIRCFRNLIIGHGCIWEERQQQPELRPGALQAVWKSIFISFLFKAHACLERYLIKIIEFDFFKKSSTEVTPWNCSWRAVIDSDLAFILTLPCILPHLSLKELQCYCCFSWSALSLVEKEMAVSLSLFYYVNTWYCMFF